MPQALGASSIVQSSSWPVQEAPFYPLFLLKGTEVLEAEGLVQGHWCSGTGLTPKTRSIAKSPVELGLGPQAQQPRRKESNRVSGPWRGWMGSVTSAQPTVEGQENLHSPKRQALQYRGSRARSQESSRKLVIISPRPQRSSASPEERRSHFRWQLRRGSSKHPSQLQPTVKITFWLLFPSNRCLL
jgi:hypothetical protein